MCYPVVKAVKGKRTAHIRTRTKISNRVIVLIWTWYNFVIKTTDSVSVIRQKKGRGGQWEVGGDLLWEVCWKDLVWNTGLRHTKLFWTLHWTETGSFQKIIGQRQTSLFQLVAGLRLFPRNHLSETDNLFPADHWTEID
jgi:hypothetical protein